MENTAEKMPQKEGPSKEIQWMTEDRIATNEAGQAQGRKDVEAEKNMSDEEKMNSMRRAKEFEAGEKHARSFDAVKEKAAQEKAAAEKTE